MVKTQAFCLSVLSVDGPYIKCRCSLHRHCGEQLVQGFVGYKSLVGSTFSTCYLNPADHAVC